MRYLLVVLILVGTGVGLWYTLEGGHAALSQELDIAPATPDPGRIRSEPAQERVETVQLVAPGIAPGAAPQTNAAKQGSGTPVQKGPGRASLEGTLTDRFGNPVARERVFLLAATQGHPAAGANFSEYVTAISSKSGGFSLSLPGAGPWRIGVGPPGAPRIPPSEARSLTGTERASIVLPGATVLRVAFDALPAGDAPVTLEFLTLVEPGVGEPGDRPGRPAGRGQRGKRRQEGTTPGAARPGGRSNRGNGNGNKSGKTRDASVPRATPTPARSSSRQHASVQQEFAGKSLSRRQGKNQEPRKEEAQPLGPPAEVWRARRRKALTAQERVAGLVEMRNLPAGRVARLAVSFGDERREGVTRFTMQADVITEVRVLPLQPGSDSLSYVVTARPVSPAESPAGFRWGD